MAPAKQHHERIPLTKGMHALVDSGDHWEMSLYKWYAQSSRHGHYACRAGGLNEPKVVRMHRQILDAPVGVFVDHKNHNGLDNRRSNLRTCTPRQNAYNSRNFGSNTSRFKGVHWRKARKKWEVLIKRDGRQIYVGRFNSEVQAAAAYDVAAIIHHGEFACTNYKVR